MAGFAGVVVRPEVVREVAKGRSHAQESIYEDFSKPVYTMAFQVLRDVQLAEDVTHDVFVDVFTNASKLRDPSSFSGWIRRIAVNRCLMVLRSSSYKSTFSADEQTLSDESIAIDHEGFIDLERALQVLPSISRAVIWLFVVEGYSHSEIGDLFHKSESFSKSQLKRALAKLRGRLGGNAVAIDHSLRHLSTTRSCEAI